MGIIAGTKKFLKRNKVIVTILLIGAVSVYLLYLNKENFVSSKSMLENKEVVMVFSPGCIHCEELMPIWELIQQRYADNHLINVYKIDNDKNPKFGIKHNIDAFPTIISLTDGKMMKSYRGRRQFEDLVRFIDFAVAGK